MAKYTKNKQNSNISKETEQQAMSIAKGIQRPGQTKEQTKLIAQGIQKGIEQYKKQQKSKARELDKKLKQAKRQTDMPNTGNEESSFDQKSEKPKLNSIVLPWILLVISWAGFAAYIMAN